MINELISSITHLPELRKIEYAINTKSYWLGSPNVLKEALSSTIVNGDNSQASLYKKVFEIIRFSADISDILKSVNTVKNIFSKMPLKLQLKHIFNIPRCIDECSFMEDYKISSVACESVIRNHLMMTYAEIILPQLDNSKKIDFLNNLHDNLHKGGWMGGKFYEEDHLIVINKWQLEHELPCNTHPCKKAMKI